MTTELSLQNPFGMHYQSVWQERAGDHTLPLWVRISALAFGCHRANGHASFKPGEVRLILGKLDTDGIWTVPRPEYVSRAITTAKRYGWIAAESTARCLVVPSYAVQGGLGNPNDPCAIHHGKRTGKRKT